MTDEELRALVDAEFAQAMGRPDSEISLERARAWRFYLGEPMGNEVDGQSAVVSMDVADVVDGLMPSVQRILTTADNLVSFDAVGPEDEEKAQQESDYVNYVIFKQNPAFEIFYTWSFDALTQKNGIVKVRWDEAEHVTQESYRGLSPEELAGLLDDDELEVIEASERQQLTIVDVPQQLPGGQTVAVQQQQVATVHDVTFRRVTKRGQVCIENVPPEEYRISPDARTLDPSHARMVGHERLITRSDLLDMGFDKDLVYSLPPDGDKRDTAEKIARYDRVEEQDTMAARPFDRSQDRILVREAYIRVDFDGDGRSELRQVFTASKRLLSNEIVDRQPFHVISPQPLPHKHFGRSSADKVMDIQRVNSTLLRQTLTNLYHSNQPSHAVWEQGIGDNTLEDLLTTRVGSIKRFARPVSESYQTISIPFTAQASFSMLEYFEKQKRDRTGISSDGEGLSPEALKNIQQSVLAQASDLSRMKIELVVRIFAETGFKSLALHVHELLLKHQDKVQLVKLRNRWVEVDPSEWRTRRDMTVNIGLGIGTRQENLLHLNAIWEKQAQIVQAGGFGTLVTPMNVYNTAAELVKNANLKNPELFFTPTDQVQPPNDEQAALQRQQMELQARQQALDAERQQVAAAKLELQAQKQLFDAEQARAKLGLDAGELDRKREADADKLFIAMEQIRTKLAELELATGQNVPGSGVPGSAGNGEARAT